MSTSRIARKPIVIPSGVQVQLQDDLVNVKGPKGSLSLKLDKFVKVSIKDNIISIAQNTDRKAVVITGKAKKLFRSIAGTTRANIHNLVHGVSQSFEKKLKLEGVGYRAQLKGKVLSLSLGYSHPTEYSIPEGVTIDTPSQTEIIVKGTNKQLVGQVAAKIRAIRSPEYYKGKGVRYADEKIILKETKKK